MIRKIIIVVLATAAVGTAVLWDMSFRLNRAEYVRGLVIQREYEARGKYIHVYPWDFLGLWTNLKFGEHKSLLLQAQSGRLKLEYRRAYPWSHEGALGNREPPVSKTTFQYGVLYYRQKALLDDWEEEFYEAIASGDLTLADRLVSEQPKTRRWRVSRELGCSFWLLFLLFATYPAVTYIRGPLRRYHRRKRGLCVRCGYNLTGNVSGVCPECGTVMRVT